MQISKFTITNYRSLVDFKVEKFDSTTIFYGGNNAGKSNILNALNVIFKRKEEYDIKSGFLPPKNFYEGLIRNFSHNFFKQDDTLSIDFSIELIINKTELQIAKELDKLIKKWPPTLTIKVEGSITKNDVQYEAGLAEIKTKSITLEGIKIYNPLDVKGFYFPTLINKDKSNVSILRDAFSSFINPLNDCISIIPNSRDMLPIAFNHEEETTIITPNNFKQFLYKLYLSKRDHSIFEEINSVFSADPFAFGTISFSKDEDDLEIMIKENGIRLPIKHLGSGVLQILYIISEVIYTKAKIVCIEELEQNLSPKLQISALVKLQSMISKEVDQIIISSHSPVFARTKLSKAIHLIEKEDMKTKWIEEIKNDKLGAKLKKHFIPSLLPPATYNVNAYTDYSQEL